MVAARFGCGFAPAEWDALTRHLLTKGFRGEELTLAGLSREGGRGGLIDRFHRRLLWPIRDTSGDVVGFGARRLFDDDRVEAKYLNTPETPIYKKSQLLYGVDLAKKDIARKHQAVIVEGYTDVMACHLAGVTTAVATCGTAFGSEHVSMLRRLLMDSDATGEVIFTFDGDAAGMKAAERAFGDDQKFVAQTFVAIEPTGMDPCDLRLKSGETAVRDLVARRIPLVEFVLRTTVARFNLDTAEGRVAAMDAGIPAVSRIKDRSLRDEYARRLAGLIGFGLEEQVLARVRGLERADRSPCSVRPTRAARGTQVDESVVARSSGRCFKVALQLPAVAGPEFDALNPEAFLSTRTNRFAGRSRTLAAPRPSSPARRGPRPCSSPLAADDRVRNGVQALAVDPLRSQPVEPMKTTRVTSSPGCWRDRRPQRQIAAIKSKRAADQPAGAARRARAAVRRVDRARELPPRAARTRPRPA